MADSIVIEFDVFEHRFSHQLPGWKALAVNGFYLERVEETFCTGIIVAVALSAHARCASRDPA